MLKKTLYLIALLVLACAIWLATRFFAFYLSPIWLIVFAAALWWVVPYLPGFLQKTSSKVWIIAGVIALVGLVPPTALIAEGFLVGPPPFQTILGAAIFFMPPAALIVSALLLYSGLLLLKERRRFIKEAAGEPPGQGRKPVWVIALAFTLFALLLARTIHNIYWLMVWDGSTDSLGNVWLMIPVLASLISGAMLLAFFPGKARLVGVLYAVLVPALMIAVSARAMSVSFRQRTEDRAARVSQAIEAFNTHVGHYPQNLRQLVPWYALWLPGPVILYGQGWCYVAGENYYRLAYVDRQHWSSPYLFAHVYSTKGNVPSQPPACDHELNTLIQSRPDYYVRKEGE